MLQECRPEQIQLKSLGTVLAESRPLAVIKSSTEGVQVIEYYEESNLALYSCVFFAAKVNTDLFPLEIMDPD